MTEYQVDRQIVVCSANTCKMYRNYLLFAVTLRSMLDKYNRMDYGSNKYHTGQL